MNFSLKEKHLVIMESKFRLYLAQTVCTCAFLDEVWKLQNMWQKYISLTRNLPWSIMISLNKIGGLEFPTFHALLIFVSFCQIPVNWIQKEGFFTHLTPIVESVIVSNKIVRQVGDTLSDSVWRKTLKLIVTSNRLIYIQLHLFIIANQPDQRIC